MSDFGLIVAEYLQIGQRVCYGDDPPSSQLEAVITARSCSLFSSGYRGFPLRVYRITAQAAFICGEP